MVEESVYLKRLQRKLSLQKVKGTNNRRKTIEKIQKQYQTMNNKKKDKANKFISYLNDNFRYIAIQDENLKGWHKGNHGKAIQHSILGRVKSKLTKQNNVFVVDRFVATSKTCSECGERKGDLKVWDREFICPSCGVVLDRDVNASINILNFGLENVGMERTEVTLVETKPSAIEGGCETANKRKVGRRSKKIPSF